MSRVQIVADDLTSAADASGPFARSSADGMPLICLDPRASHIAQVVAIDIDSRSRSEREAVALTTTAFSHLTPADVAIKTIDSTLRGHIVAEIRSALAASGRGVAVVAPAFPSEGRTTRGGVQFVDGVPVHQSSFGADPTHPVTTSSILELLAPLNPSMLNDNSSEVASGVVVADAHDQHDLDAVVARFGLEQVLWVGSPGLCQAIAAARDPQPPRTSTASLHAGPTLFAVGSLHPNSTAQLNHLAASGFEVIEAGIHDLAQLTGDIAIATGRRRSNSDAVAQLAAAAAEAVASGQFNRLVLTGGTTARAVLDRCRITELRVGGEIAPGVVATRSARHGLDIIIKAGGFGQPSLLTDFITPQETAQ